jgi:uncharacterized protein
MTDRLLILMTSGPDTPHRCAAPFYFATTAAGMDYEVDMFFTMDGAHLLKQGVAEQVSARPGAEPIAHFMRLALESGVRFSLCSASAELFDLTRANVLPNVQWAGAAWMLQTMEEATSVLSF